MLAPIRPTLCLIIESNPVVGLDLADALVPCHWYVSGPFTSGREALKWLSRFTPDVAVVGQPLADGLYGEVLRELRERGVPCLAYTSDQTGMADGLRADLPRLKRPAPRDEVEAALVKLVALSA